MSYVRIVCPSCGTTLKLDTDASRAQLKHAPNPRAPYSFGDHVTDMRAFPMRLASAAGWRYTGGDIGRSVIAMSCATCARREPEVDAPVVADGAVS